MKTVTQFVCSVFVLFVLLTGVQLFAAEVPLNQAKLVIEYNATDQAAGIYALIDGDGWKKLSVTAPNGKMFSVKAKGKIGGIGLSRLELTSSKASNIPIDQFLAMFPEGDYKFKAQANGGDTLTGTSTLTHVLPDGPNITGPAAGGVVDPANTVISWDPVTTPAGVQIASYRILIEQDGSSRTFISDLSKSANSLRLPSKFLLGASSYTAKVMAVEVGGNQTYSTVAFSTP